MAKGKLDAAIELLNHELQHYKRPGSSERLREIGRGRDIIEAAAKVDKKWACGDGPDDPEKAEAVSELLEALPDEEKKNG